jgi:hypothetical protein
MKTKIARRFRGIAQRLVLEDRGDFIVTPAIMILIASSVLVIGGIVYAGAKKVAPNVNNSRQGITLDDEGNVVQGGVGVIPVPTEKPTPKPTPKETPRKVIREEVTVVQEPEPEPYQPPVYEPAPAPHDQYPQPEPEPQPHEEYDDPCVDEPGNDMEPEDGYCPGYGGGGGHTGGGHGGTS